jgi:hypothetical protein
MYSRNTKTTNEPTASNNKPDRPQVKIWDTWKTLKYLNINENRKDVDRYKGVGMTRVDFGPISETVYIDIILNTIIER